MGLEEVRGADVGVVGLGSPLAKDFDGVLEDALLGSRGLFVGVDYIGAAGHFNAQKEAATMIEYSSCMLEPEKFYILGGDGLGGVGIGQRKPGRAGGRWRDGE